MIDFTNCPVNIYRYYGGRNGNKICISYDHELYMLKFSPAGKENMDASYTNGCISEHLGSSIFNIIGIEAQKTLLGRYAANGKEKIVVACRDFVEDDYRLMLFGELKNACIETSRDGFGTDLEEVLTAIEEQQLVDPVFLSEFFWDMFVVDAYLGNFDRHNGNWGFLINEKRGSVKMAPVFDCGSCLYPQLDEKNMMRVMNSPEEIEKRIYVFPNSALRYKNKKINYLNFMSSGQSEGCNHAIRRIAPVIDENHDKVLSFIDEQPNELVSRVQKDFYKLMLAERKEKIVDYAYEKVNEKAVERERKLSNRKNQYRSYDIEI